mgnify:CR=1 FL=1
MKSRQLEILLYLMETKKTTYAELAQHFEVSKKTVMRDIDKLSGMGIPIHTQPGYKGGIFLLSDYRFSKSFFTATEIEDIILAFHIVRHLDLRKEKHSALKKLELLIPELTFLKELDFDEYLYYILRSDGLYLYCTDGNSFLTLKTDQISQCEITNCEFDRADYLPESHKK